MGQEYWAYHGSDHFRAQKAGEFLPGGGGEDVVRLHLGAGKRYFRGYVNIDVQGDRLDKKGDIRKLDYPDESVDEILAVHVFEHFWADEVEGILKEWNRVLKPGGKLILEMPDLKKVLKLFEDPKSPVNLTYGALYGGYIFGSEGKTVEDLHKWIWTFDTLSVLAEKAGFECQEEVAQYHVPQRDFRIVCVKAVS